LVAGSKPAEPTFESNFPSSDVSSFQKVGGSPSDLLPLRELLHILLGNKGRRTLELRQKTNKELFPLYDGELAFHHRSARGLHEAKRILDHFHSYLGEFPPTPELAKSFLSKFTNRKPTTVARYAAILKMFFKWYGEELDIKLRVPKLLPSYVEKSDIEKLLAAIENKRSHKTTVERDLLLVDIAIHTGLRRSELANLIVGDIDLERQLLIVRQGKGAKDRVIPLSGKTCSKLAGYIENKEKGDSLFNLTAASISGKIKTFARKAGVELHAHSLRDYFATSLSEKGATIREIQSLLGHANLTHTERYTLHTDKHLKKAIELLDQEGNTQDVSSSLEPQHYSGEQPIIVIEPMYKDEAGQLSTATPVYFAQFVISNEGKEPAMQLEIGLFDSNKNLLQGRRDPVLMIGDKIVWRPNLRRTDGNYFVVCQYKKALSESQSEMWYQSWLPFRLTEAAKIGEVYVAPEQIILKKNVTPSEKLTIFS
jgi:integrase/recombinase XerD